MSRRLGLDVDQMNQLVKVLTTEAQQLESTVKNVAAKVQSVWWEGDDARRFKDQEWAEHARALNQAAKALRDAATAATRQVRDQESVSSR
jgi:uncharacterized protein YukE